MDKYTLAILIEDDNGVKELPVTRVTHLTVKDKEMIFLEKYGEDEWRLTYTTKTIPDILKLKLLRLVRVKEPSTK